jgi:hypothetical protein
MRRLRSLERRSSEPSALFYKVADGNVRSEYISFARVRILGGRSPTATFFFILTVKDRFSKKGPAEIVNPLELVAATEEFY